MIGQECMRCPRQAYQPRREQLSVGSHKPCDLPRYHTQVGTLELPADRRATGGTGHTRSSPHSSTVPGRARNPSLNRRSGRPGYSTISVVLETGNPADWQWPGKAGNTRSRQSTENPEDANIPHRVTRADAPVPELHSCVHTRPCDARQRQELSPATLADSASPGLAYPFTALAALPTSLNRSGTGVSGGTYNRSET